MAAGTLSQQDGIQLHTLACGHEGVISFISWSPDGRSLATSSLDKSLRIWDGETFKNPKIATGHDWNVSALTWAPQGQSLATVSDDRRVLLWDYPSLTMVGEIQHDKGIVSVAWSSNGKDILTCANEKSIRVFDAHKKTLKTTLKSGDGLPKFMAFSHSCYLLKSRLREKVSPLNRAPCGRQGPILPGEEGISPLSANTP